MRVWSVLPAMLILCASCTLRKSPEPEAATPAPTSVSTGIAKIKPAAVLDSTKNVDKEGQKILHWFEQMDAIYREALWVIRREKSPQGKSIFGKMHRALLVNMKQKLSNKSLFKCDVYTMTRNVSGLGGVPQNAEVLHQCNTRESYIPIGDWNHAKANELTMNFRGGNLAEVLGFTTGILSPKINCKLKSSDNGIVETFSCEGLMLDYNPAKNQVLRFNRFEYQKNSQNMLHIKAEVLENLDPVRKIEVDIPLEGKITVTETVLQPPQFVAKPAPPTPPPAPTTPQQPPEAISAEDIYHDRNGKEIDREENPQTRGVRGPQRPKIKPQQQTQNPYEGSLESSDGLPPQRQQSPQEGEQQQGPQVQIPQNSQDVEAPDQNRENSTR